MLGKDGEVLAEEELFADISRGYDYHPLGELLDIIHPDSSTRSRIQDAANIAKLLEQ